VVCGITAPESIARGTPINNSGYFPRSRATTESPSIAVPGETAS
jgi:hypothetical protein